MRFAHCVFCDDIRAEVGGKLSLMGIYQGDLLVPVQPTVLPKLCMVVTAVTTADQPFEKVTARIASKERVFLEQTLPEEAIAELQATLKASADPEDPYSKMAIVINLAIAPFVVDSAFTLKATVIADGEELPAGRLRVGFAASWPPLQNPVS